MKNKEIKRYQDIIENAAVQQNTTVPQRIESLDAILRSCSLPLLRRIDRQLASDIRIAEGEAHAAILLRRHLASNVTISSMWWQNNPWKELFLPWLEAVATNGEEWPFHESWRATFYDTLDQEGKNAITTKLNYIAYSREKAMDRFKLLRRYIFNYVNSITQPVEVIESLAADNKAAITLNNTVAILNPSHWEITA